MNGEGRGLSGVTTEVSLTAKEGGIYLVMTENSCRPRSCLWRSNQKIEHKSVRISHLQNFLVFPDDSSTLPVQFTVTLCPF